ncbi:MAG: hypothetical protein GX162_06455 [Firmicutes bacterium]|nr:hypothetical protein [Bacillota bacterium]
MSTTRTVVFAAELNHRGHIVTRNLDKRRTVCRSTRNRKTRYRKPRFNNRRRSERRLASSDVGKPSRQHRDP